MLYYDGVAFPLLFPGLLTRLLLIRIVSENDGLREAVSPGARLRNNGMGRLMLDKSVIVILIIRLAETTHTWPFQRHSVSGLLIDCFLLFQSLDRRGICDLFTSRHWPPLLSVLQLATSFSSPTIGADSLDTPLRTISIVLNMMQINRCRTILIEVALRSVKHGTIINFKNLRVGGHKLYAR